MWNYCAHHLQNNRLSNTIGRCDSFEIKAQRPMLLSCFYMYFVIIVGKKKFITWMSVLSCDGNEVHIKMANKKKGISINVLNQSFCTDLFGNDWRSINSTSTFNFTIQSTEDTPLNNNIESIIKGFCFKQRRRLYTPKLICFRPAAVFLVCTTTLLNFRLFSSIIRSFDEPR